MHSGVKKMGNRSFFTKGEDTGHAIGNAQDVPVGVGLTNLSN